MATEIDSLQIQINANAQKADTALDNLITRLDTLTTSLTGLDGSNLTSFAGGVRDLGLSMQLFKSTKAVDFNKIARGIDKFSQIDSSSFTKISGGLVGLATGLGNISNVDNLGGIAKVVNAVKNLASVDASKFNTVAFDAIGISVKNFASSLTTIGNVDKNIVSLVTAVSRLSASGKNIENVSREFPAIANNIVDFITKLNGANVSFDVGGLATLVGNIRNLGGKVATNAIINLPLLGDAMAKLMATLSKAPQVSSNVIQITTALANLSAQGSKVGNSTRSIERGLNRASRSATRAGFSFRSLASLFGMFYANAFLVIRGINGIKKAIDSTADYLEAYNYFNVALGKVGSDWAHQWETYAEEIGVSSAEEYADSFATRLKERLKSLSGLEINVDDSGAGLLTETGLQNLGLNIQEVTQYASQLASVTNSVGQVGEVSLATASSLTKLGADLSSLFNLDYSDVMANLQSGLIGQSRALYKYGIDITNATLQTYAYGLGLTKSVSEMTQMEKMQLRLIAILDQSKVSWGDLANTINSPSNMMRQFSNNAKELGMVLGQLFIPALQKVMPVVNGATIAIKRLLVSLANLLGIKLDLDSFGQGFTNLEEDTEGLADSLDGVSKSAKKAYMGLLGFDKLNVIKTPDDAKKSTGGASGDTIDLTKEILKATEEYEKTWQKAFDEMENKAQDFADAIDRIFKPITDPFKDMINNIRLGGWTQAGEYAGDTVSAIFDQASKALENVDWNSIGRNIALFIKGIEWTNVFKSVGNFIETAIDSAVDLWKGAFKADPIATAIVSALALSKFTGLDKVLWGKITAALSATVGTTSIGFVPTVIIGAVTWVIAFDVGKSLGEALFPDDAYWYQNFTWFGDGGFFKELENAGLANILIALNNMATDLASVILPDEVANEVQVAFEKAVRLLENYDWSNLVNDIKENFWLVAFDTSLMQPNPIELVVDFLNKITAECQVFADGIKKMFELLIGGIHDLISNTKFNFNIGGLSKIGNVGGGIKGFATGGFPNEYSLFMAGEHGHAEMLGTVGGKTAVAGGAEITGIREEIRNTANEEIALLRQQNALLQGILEKEFGISTDAVGRAAQSWARDYSRRTGRPAY